MRVSADSHFFGVVESWFSVWATVGFNASEVFFSVRSVVLSAMWTVLFWVFLWLIGYGNSGDASVARGLNPLMGGCNWGAQGSWVIL